ncbi:threonylcarbamoyl-AMP synthase [Methylobacterium sp. WL30]|uniref:L-threonylcarbamoyladenylate synthase n=1 Tax=unclassified Methylobacterium TaxID=2615210 RepID=UPI0011C98023|nr:MULTISPECIES: L-threonylcarbamoyladenylate synthase [unclassified Methylobacterium]TXN39660.1 threonylcarbamoyl-AMP synthase [Methylobacterium sp. WL93]TXN49202.1 threonylcarbamoyl-AMP synthase [Methylobacterium sp. WL119]TXN66982.1 threonylcarbamoyl-AMP synthase [Methylobacterium sp. WL30]
MNDLASIPAPASGRRPTARLPGDGSGVAEAARLIRAGACVAFPTETVYGLGADATDAEAVAGIFAAKARPRFNPLIAHLPGRVAAEGQGTFDDHALRLAEAFWPGPLTLVVPASGGTTVCDLARAGLPSVALRVPANPLARDLLDAIGRPVAAPSANRSGRVSPTRADHVLADLDGRIAAVLDGGDTPVGIESTVIACLGGPPRLLRPGGITGAAIAAVLGTALAAPAQDDAARPIGPGLLASHYAPRAALRLDAEVVEPDEAVLLFGASRPVGIERARAVSNLSPRGDLTEAASRLFAALRDLDASGAATIAVCRIPADGLGEAILDRLGRAAAPR